MPSKEWYCNHLDGLFSTLMNAEEEYESWLREYEEEYGEEARNEYEDKHV